MFHITSHPSLAGRVSAREMGSPRPRRGHSARLLRIACGLALVCALAFGWRYGSDSPFVAWLNGSTEWDCVSFGRAGAHCVRRPSNDRADGKVSDSRCIVSVRGDRICPLLPERDAAPR